MSHAGSTNTNSVHFNTCVIICLVSEAKTFWKITKELRVYRSTVHKTKMISFAETKSCMKKFHNVVFTSIQIVNMTENFNSYQCHADDVPLDLLRLALHRLSGQ